MLEFWEIVTQEPLYTSFSHSHYGGCLKIGGLFFFLVVGVPHFAHVGAHQSRVPIIITTMHMRADAMRIMYG